MQQAVSLGHIAGVGRSADDGVHQAGISINPDMRLHAEVPLVAFLDLVHLGVTLTCAVLGGARCCNQGGVHHRAVLEQQSVGSQFWVDDLQNPRAQLMRFEQVAKSQDADPVRNALGATDAHKVTVEAGLEQSFFCSEVGQAKPLLQAMNAQHRRKIKRRAARLVHGGVWRDQREQFAPRHDLLHFIEQDFLARTPGVEVQAKIFLLHGVIDCKLHALFATTEAEF